MGSRESQNRSTRSMGPLGSFGRFWFIGPPVSPQPESNSLELRPRGRSGPGGAADLYFLDVAYFHRKNLEHRLDASIGHRLFAKLGLLVLLRRGPGRWG